MGREEGSIDRLAETISRFKAVEQIVAVTDSEAFGERADHVVRLEKEAGEQKFRSKHEKALIFPVFFFNDALVILAGNKV